MLINVKNTKKVNEAIAMAEGRAKSRCIDIYDINSVVKEVEKALNLPKCHMVGVTVKADVNAQKFPNAYYKKGSPMSTHFSLERRPSGWFITDINRFYCGRNKRIRITIPESLEAKFMESNLNF